MGKGKKSMCTHSKMMADLPTFLFLYIIVNVFVRQAIRSKCLCTLVVALATKTFGEVAVTYEWYTFSLRESRLSGGGIQRWWGQSIPPCCSQIHLNFLHPEVVGTLKGIPHSSCTHLHLLTSLKLLVLRGDGVSCSVSSTILYCV